MDYYCCCCCCCTLRREVRNEIYVAVGKLERKEKKRKNGKKKFVERERERKN